MPQDLKPDLSAPEPSAVGRPGWRRKVFPAVAVVCPLFLLLATPLAARWIETDVRDRVNESARLNGLAPLGVTVEGRDVVLGRTPTSAELASAEEHLRSLRGVGTLRIRDDGSDVESPPTPETTSTTAPADSFTPVEVEEPVSTSGTPAFDVSGVRRESGALVPGSIEMSNDQSLVPSGALDSAPDRAPAISTSSTTVVVEGVAAAIPVGPPAPTTTIGTTDTTAPSNTTTTAAPAAIPTTTAAVAEPQTTLAPATTAPATTAPATTAPTTTMPTTTVPITAAPTTTTTAAPTTTTTVPNAADATPRVIIEIAPSDVLISGKVGSDDERDAVLGAFAGDAQVTLFTNTFVVEQGHASLITGALADYLALLERHASYASVTIEPGLIEVIVEVPSDAAAAELAQAASTLKSVGWQVDDSLEVNI